MAIFYIINFYNKLIILKIYKKHLKNNHQNKSKKS